MPKHMVINTLLTASHLLSIKKDIITPPIQIDGATLSRKHKSGPLLSLFWIVAITINLHRHKTQLLNLSLSLYQGSPPQWSSDRGFITDALLDTTQPGIWDLVVDYLLILHQGPRTSKDYDSKALQLCTNSCSNKYGFISFSQSNVQV